MSRFLGNFPPATRLSASLAASSSCSLVTSLSDDLATRRHGLLGAPQLPLDLMSFSLSLRRFFVGATSAPETAGLLM
jgi:hypothetical protein